MFLKKSDLFSKVCLQYNSHRTLKSLSSNSYRIPRSSYTIFASAAAIGLSVYVVRKNKAVCDIDPHARNHSDRIPQDRYRKALERSRDILQRVKDEKGIPGLVIGVSIDGKKCWEEGFGFADIENRILCSPDTIMRIASVSKSITMTAVAKLWEQGKLDLDKPVQEYVPYFPQKCFDGKPVTITTRQLVSHLGGIRHYKEGITEKDVEKKLSELYNMTKHTDLKTALDMFKDDPLIENPGSKFSYSSHGFTLLSAVVEAASKEKFTTHITKMFKSLGMKYTYLDENDVLIYSRSRYYVRSNEGTLLNAPYVDNSYKWAGGGFLSTVGDLMQFANAMLYSFQYRPKSLQTTNEHNTANLKDGKLKNANINDSILSSEKTESIKNRKPLPGYLNNKTMEAMWQPVAPPYGMGWAVTTATQECQFCENPDFSVFHPGGAIGASSILFILPKNISKDEGSKSELLPKGVVVAVICNMDSVDLSETAHRIAKEFENL